MTLSQIKYVLEIAKTGSINKAASNLFFSQSMLSTSIKRLEAEIGQQIFYRTTKGIRLTSFGQSFLSYLQPIQLQLDQLESMISHSSCVNSATLSVATNGYFFIDELISKLHWKYRQQGIRVELYEDYGASIVDLVTNRICEIGFIRLWSCYKRVNMRQINSMGLEYYPLVTRNVGITIGEHNPLYHTDLTEIHASMLAQYPAILYECMDSGPYAGIFDKIGIPSGSNRIVTNSRAALYSFIQHTDGYYLNSFHPEETIKNRPSFPQPSKKLMIKDCPITSEQGWFKRSDSVTSQLATELITAVSEYLQEY